MTDLAKIKLNTFPLCPNTRQCCKRSRPTGGQPLCIRRFRREDHWHLRRGIAELSINASKTDKYTFSITWLQHSGICTSTPVGLHRPNEQLPTIRLDRTAGSSWWPSLLCEWQYYQTLKPLTFKINIYRSTATRRNLVRHGLIHTMMTNTQKSERFLLLSRCWLAINLL